MEATLPLKHEVVDTPQTQGEGASELDCWLQSVGGGFDNHGSEDWV